MEQCYRIAILMFLLTGYLQANPIKTCFNINDLHINYLRENVNCGQGVNFTSPTNVQGQCYAAALKCFTEGLEHANSECTDEEERIIDSLNALEKAKCLQTAQKDSSECKWETEGSRKQFADFVTDLEKFVQLVNNNLRSIK
uniref:Interleukin n=1 Tax=Mastacembelus armatus TaxID=205130 RepID=A0A7N8X6Y8_9TELE